MMFQRFASIEMSNKVMNAANNLTLVVCAALYSFNAVLFIIFPNEFSRCTKTNNNKQQRQHRELRKIWSPSVSNEEKGVKGDTFIYFIYSLPHLEND